MKKLTQKEFINKANIAHNYVFDYSLCEYKDSRTKIKIICCIHGIFEQKPLNHIILKQGCPSCGHNISYKEINWLNSLGIPLEFRNISIKINGKTIRPDGLDSVSNIVYEFYGDFWHGNPSIFSKNDINVANNKTYGELYNKTIERENVLKSAGYKIVSIWEREWDNEHTNL